MIVKPCISPQKGHCIRFNTDSPQQVIFGSPDATVSSLYHIEETAPGILLV